MHIISNNQILSNCFTSKGIEGFSNSDINLILTNFLFGFSVSCWRSLRINVGLFVCLEDWRVSRKVEDNWRRYERLSV